MDFFLAHGRLVSLFVILIQYACSTHTHPEGIKRTCISRQLIVSIRDRNVNHIYTNTYSTHTHTVYGFYFLRMKNALMLADLIWKINPQTECDIAEMISLATTSDMASTSRWRRGKIIQLLSIWWQKCCRNEFYARRSAKDRGENVENILIKSWNSAEMLN